MFNDRAAVSAQRRDFLKRLLDEAFYQASGANSGSDLRAARDKLQEVLERMKDKSERMLREDHEQCWQRWLEVNETAKWKRKEICDFNYGHFKNEACQAKGWAEDLPKDAKAKVKDVQVAMKGRTMEKWQFDEINDILNDAWKVASSCLQRKYQEGQRRHEEWQQKQREAKSRRLEVRERKEDQLRNHQNQVDKCYEMLGNARSRERENLIEGWIAEHQSKIRDLEDTIRDIDRVISDIDSKL
jgi:hypothetical protein